MNLIDKQLDIIKAQKRIGLMTHVVVGYPSLEDTVKLVNLMEDVGVDFVELQIPFSDPLADGPTIMKACEAALNSGVRVKDAFKVARTLSESVKIPLLFMAYFNNVFKYGTERFCRDAKESGISGLIVPDIPIEEEACEHFLNLCDKYDLYPIRVLSPASTDSRLKINAAVAKGFVYCTARQGITGAKDQLDPKLVEFLQRVRRSFDIPIGVGFGISKVEHVEKVKHHADIAIVGSAIIDVINSSDSTSMLINVEKFLRSYVGKSVIIRKSQHQIV